MKEVLVAALVPVAEGEAGKGLRCGHAGGEARRHEERGKHRLVDQREADERRDQEARVRADREREDERDPLQHHAPAVEEPDDAVEEPKADLREKAAKRHEREDADRRDVDEQRHHAETHHGRGVVVDQDAPEVERIRQVEDEADHAEQDGRRADDRRCLQDGRVLMRLLPVEVEDDRSRNRAAGDARKEQVHGDGPGPGNAMREADCKVHVHVTPPSSRTECTSGSDGCRARGGCGPCPWRG